MHKGGRDCLWLDWVALINHIMDKALWTKTPIIAIVVHGSKHTYIISHIQESNIGASKMYSYQ